MSPSAPTPRGSGAREALADAALLAVDAALTVGAALRVTRFATTDVLGGWALSDPLHRWASRHEPGQPFGYLAPPEAWRHRLVSALDCPFCVGTQAALVIGGALAVTSSRTAPYHGPLRPHRHRRSPLGRALRAAAASLTAAYVVGHVSHRLDTPAQPAPAPAPAPTATAKDSK
nr:MAG TPA: Protein of unknown function (DUF1360) [Caudoviricetes sp.]